MWPLLAERLMLFPHSWVRGATDRLLGHYFVFAQEQHPFKPESEHNTPSGKKGKKDKEKERKEIYLAGKGKLFELGHLLCKQMDSKVIDEALGEQIVKDLVFVFRQLLAHPNLTPADLVSFAFDRLTCSLLLMLRSDPPR